MISIEALLLAGVALTLGTALVAAWLPARSLSKVDPAQGLSHAA
ncbi:hypothetical protein [Garicola koreensis]